MCSLFLADMMDSYSICYNAVIDGGIWCHAEITAYNYTHTPPSKYLYFHCSAVLSYTAIIVCLFWLIFFSLGSWMVHTDLMTTGCAYVRSCRPWHHRTSKLTHSFMLYYVHLVSSFLNYALLQTMHNNFEPSVVSCLSHSIVVYILGWKLQCSSALTETRYPELQISYVH